MVQALRDRFQTCIFRSSFQVSSPIKEKHRGEECMETKLTTLNLHLARAVLVASAVFAVSVTLLAAVTGETVLFLGTGLGVAAGAYALVVARKPSGEFVQLRPSRHTVAA
jgi:hypothetical protein